MSQLRKISPEDAKTLIDKGATLIDIREGDERARLRIEGSQHLPLSKLGSVGTVSTGNSNTVVFHCKSGNRTAVNAAKLSAKTPCDAYIMDGGIDAWAAKGLPVVTATSEKKAPIEIIRQVMIVAGTLVLSGVGLGLTVSPNWFFLAAFVGAGLMFSGVSGYCLMAYILRHMPWNKGYA